MLGSASQSPTRHRNHNGYLLRFDDQLVLFDPGEGTQRQATIAGTSLARLTAVCITHFHGDHCLGLPGVIQTLNGHGVERTIDIFYPRLGQVYFDRLRHASIYNERTPIHPVPIDSAGPVGTLGEFVLSVAELDHRTTAFGYRIDEPDRMGFDRERLRELGLTGAAVGHLAEEGTIELDGRTISVDEVAEPRMGQSVAVVLDTRPCPGASTLARGVDLLIAESTFLDRDDDLAEKYGHMTARQAGRLAAEAGACKLVLTHFSQRYDNADEFVAEAAAEFDGPIIGASDFDVIDVPPRER